MGRKLAGICAFLMLFCISQPAWAIQEHWLEGQWTKGFRNERVYDAPPAFEKMYVTNDQIMRTPDGIYLKLCTGETEKVRALLEDNDGLYILRIKTQCCLCGQSYDGKAPPEGYSCPLYDKEVMPYMWIAP
jgi:hypothetical protein